MIEVTGAYARAGGDFVRKEPCYLLLQQMKLRGENVTYLLTVFLWILALGVTSVAAAPKKLTCEHIEEIATNWNGSKTAPVDVLFTAVFDPADLELPDPTYEFTLVKWEPRTEKLAAGMDLYIERLSIGSTYVQPMKATPTTLMLDDYKFKGGLVQPAGPYTIQVSRSDLTYTLDSGHRLTTGKCRIEDLIIENIF